MSRRLIALGCSLVLLVIGMGPLSAAARPVGDPGLASAAPTTSAVERLTERKAALDARGTSLAPSTGAEQQPDLAPLSTLPTDAAIAGAGMSPAVATLQPVYRLTDKYTGSMFLTDDFLEAAAYMEVLGEYYQYDGCAFLHDPVNDIPLYRFYNKQTSGYFYTADLAERDRIIALYSNLYEYDGECAKVSLASGSGRQTVYRFSGGVFGDHCLVTEQSERDRVIATMGYRWMYEGVAFYAYPPNAPAGTGSVTGTVRDPWGSPLMGLRVRVVAADDSGTWTETTDASGAYTVGGLPGGTYYVTFSIWPRFYWDGWGGKPEYYSNVHVYDGPALSPVTVVEGAPTTGIDAQLEHIPVPVYRFYNAGSGTHFYTPSATEAQSVIDSLSHVFTYEGVCYYLNPANNTQPLFRFYNFRNNSHFYTADAAERDHIITYLSGTYSYDGPTYSVNRVPVPGSIPVYRFYRWRNGSHFYTADESERANVEMNLRDTYTPEGPVYWLGQ